MYVIKVDNSFNKHFKHPMLNVAKLLGLHCQKPLFPSCPHIPSGLKCSWLPASTFKSWAVHPGYGSWHNRKYISILSLSWEPQYRSLLMVSNEIYFLLCFHCFFSLQGTWFLTLDFYVITLLLPSTGLLVSGSYSLPRQLPLPLLFVHTPWLWLWLLSLDA